MIQTGSIEKRSASMRILSDDQIEDIKRAAFDVMFKVGIRVHHAGARKMLKQAGYVSGIYGKWDLGVHRRFLPPARGFDDFYGFVNTGIDYYTHERYGVPSMYHGTTPTEEDKGPYCTYLFELEAILFLENHATKIMKKLSLHNQLDLVRYAARVGLIDLDLWKT